MKKSSPKSTHHRPVAEKKGSKASSNQQEIKGSRTSSNQQEKRGSKTFSSQPKEKAPKAPSGRKEEKGSKTSSNQQEIKTSKAPSSNRQEKHSATNKPSKGSFSRCPVSRKCGGCQYIDMPYEEQLSRKQKLLTSLLSPFGKPQPIIGMEQPDFYRNKVHAVFGLDSKRRPTAGVYEAASHRIVPVESCFLEDQKATAIIQTIKELLPSFKIKVYDEDSGYGLLRHVLIRTARETGQIMVVLVLASPILPSKNNFVKALRKEHPEITTVVINVNDRKTSMVLGDKEQAIYGSGYIKDTLCGKSFKLSPKSFYQVNPVQTARLYETAVSYAGLTGKEMVLDAYCGIGTIGMIAAEKAKRVIGVELNQDAVRDAVFNAKKNGVKNIQFYQKDAGQFMVQLAEQQEKIDVVFMDPPRAGSDEAFLTSLLTCSPERIVYISCNPETLARDLKFLSRKNYKVKKIQGVDMFPHTEHIECVVSICRVNS